MKIADIFSVHDSDRVNYVRLARIVRSTLRTLYNDRQKSEEDDLEEMAVVDGLAAKIADWENSLPGFLKVKAPGSLLLIYARYKINTHIKNLNELSFN